MRDHFALLGRLEKAEDQAENANLWRETLKEGMLYMDISCFELAKETGVIPSTVRRWIKGDSTPLPGVRRYVMAHLTNRLASGNYR